MKKLISLLLCATFLLSLAACSQSPASESSAPGASEPAPVNEPKLTLSLGTTSAADDLQTKALERFAENVSEKTGGNITINVLPASQLGDAVTEMESMISGGQDMFCEAELTYMYNYGVEACAAENFGIVDTPEALAKFSASDEANELREQFRELNGIVTVGYNFYRQPIVMATQMPLATLEDFAGVKLRVVPSEATIASYEAIGFSPTSVAYSEVYLSLSQGVIEGTIAPLDAMYTMKFYEQAPYILKLGTAVTNVAVWMNEAKYSQLSDNQKQIIAECCAEAGDWYTQQNTEVVNGYVASMEAAGAVIAEPSDELVAQCSERWSELAKQYEADGKLPAGSYDKLYNAGH